MDALNVIPKKSVRTHWVLFMLHMIPRIRAGATPKDILETLNKNWDRLEAESSPHELRRWAAELQEFGEEWPHEVREGVYLWFDRDRVAKSVKERRFVWKEGQQGSLRGVEDE